MIINQRVRIFFICGTSCIIFGCLLVVFPPKEVMMNYIFTFHRGGELFNWWLNSSAANVFLKVYAFNITNPKEFMEGREKLKMQEVGPFIYREINTQEQVVFNKNGTITSKPRYEAVWVPELNELEENITLYVPNTPMLTGANEIATKFPLLTIPTNVLMEKVHSEPIQRMTWREYGFGQENPLVTLANTFLPHWVPVEKLGFVKLFNDQSDVVATLHTGGENMKLAGLVQLYNGLEHLPQWPSPCNEIQNATLGFKIKADIDDEEDFLLYFKGICRTLPFSPVGPKENRFGIPTRLYKLHADALDNGARNKANLCYCKRDGCLPDGLSDLSDCFYGFSGVLSYPHFYNANSSLLEAVEGMKPEQKLHETYLRANQETGVITEFSYRVQLNLKLGDIRAITNCSRFSNMVLPIFWADMHMSDIPLRSRIDLFLLLRVQPIADLLGAFGLIVIGIYLLFYPRRHIFAKSKLIPQRLRMLSQDLGTAVEIDRIRKGSKGREVIESEVHSKLLIND